MKKSIEKICIFIVMLVAVLIPKCPVYADVAMPPVNTGVSGSVPTVLIIGIVAAAAIIIFFVVKKMKKDGKHIDGEQK